MDLQNNFSALIIVYYYGDNPVLMPVKFFRKTGDWLKKGAAFIGENGKTASSLSHFLAKVAQFWRVARLKLRQNRLWDVCRQDCHS
ncbi:MAG: hypothetical protein GC179_15440 [Anaerolineaceae bacterium]|nr:hypothetical protein [Anaerolineaceae bacterium]